MIGVLVHLKVSYSVLLGLAGSECLGVFHLESSKMYNIIVDLVTSLMVNNLHDLTAMAVAQPTWVTYLMCIYLLSKLINKGIDTPTLQLPNMKPAIMFFVNET